MKGYASQAAPALRPLLGALLCLLGSGGPAFGQAEPLPEAPEAPEAPSAPELPLEVRPATPVPAPGSVRPSATPSAGWPPSPPLPSAGFRAAQSLQEELLERQYRARELVVLPVGDGSELRQGGPQGRRVAELELAEQLKEVALVARIEQAQRAAQRPWLLGGSALALAGLGLLLGTVAVELPSLPAAPKCSPAPCASGYDLAWYQQQYREVVESRDTQSRKQIALALTGGSLVLAGAVCFTVAASRDPAPLLGYEQRLELVDRHNRELASKLGLAGPLPAPVGATPGP